VTPAGIFVAFKAMVEFIPPLTAVVTVTLWLLPAGMVTEVADSISVNVGTTTVTLTFAELVSELLIAFTLKL